MTDKILDLLFGIDFYISLSISGTQFMAFTRREEYNKKGKKGNEG